MEQKDVMNQKRAEFIAKFTEKYAGCSCRELLGHDISVPREFEKVLEEGLLMEFCPQVVVDSIDILDELM